MLIRCYSSQRINHASGIQTNAERRLGDWLSIRTPASKSYAGANLYPASPLS